MDPTITRLDVAPPVDGPPVDTPRRGAPTIDTTGPSTDHGSFSITRRGRLRGDRGEGVISAAIAVLIMAFLGAAMWIGFQQMWKSTEATTNERISQIGSQ